MEKRAGVKMGLIGGVIIALFYVLMLWVKFNFLSYNPFVFYLSNFVSYMLIIASLVILAAQQRSKLGGYAEIKQLFQPIFVAVILAEAAYFLFTYYYLNYINPTFFDAYGTALIDFAKEQKMSEEKIQAQAEMIKGQAEASKDFWGLFKGILVRWIVVDSIFGITIAFLLRKRSPEQLAANYLDRQKF